MSYKVGDIIIYKHKAISEMYRTRKHDKSLIPLYNQIGKIVKICKYAKEEHYLIQFNKKVFPTGFNRSDGERYNKLGHMFYVDGYELRSIESLKLKKLVKHGV